MLATESETSGVEGGSVLDRISRFRDRYTWTFRGFLVLAAVGVAGFGLGFWYDVPQLMRGTAKHLAVFTVYAVVVWALVVTVDEISWFRREYFFTWTFLVIMGAGTVEALLISTMGFAEYSGVILAEQLLLLLYASIIWGIVLYLKRRLA